MFDAFYRGKRVLVTGHTGFKGSWLCQWLLMMGAEVAGVSKDIPTNPSLFESLQLTTQMHDHRVDIEQYEPLLAVLQSFRPEVVFHLAAQPIVSEAYDNPLGTYSANLMGTVNMLEAVKQAGCVQQLVMITSDKCYHNVEWGYGYRENDRLGGKDPYSASKACAEIAIHSYWHSYYRSSSTALASARAGNVIGGGDWAMSRIVPDCMRQWSEGKPMNLRSPQATRPWQHVLEPLSGYLWLAKCLADNPAISGEAYNFGPNPKSEYSVLELVKMMQTHWPQAQLSHANITNHLSEAGLLKLCCDKALHDLKWTANWDISDTVAHTVNWYRQFHERPSSVIELTTQQIEIYQRAAEKSLMVWARAQTLEASCESS